MEGCNRFINYSTPLVIALDVTTMCNLKCLHCYNNSGVQKDNEMTNEEIMDLVGQICEMKPLYVCLCGGETLLRSNLDEIISKLASNVGAVSMVSNGYLLTKERAKRLKNAGIYMVQISLDGVNELQHDTWRGKKGAFINAINAINALVDNNIKTVVSFIPNKLNYKYFDRFCEMCYKLGVNEVRSMPLIPMGRAKSIRKLQLTSDEYIYFQQLFQKNKFIYQRKKMFLQYGDPIDHLIRFPNNSLCGLKSYSMDIKADGTLSATSYLPIIVGNLRKHTLKEYWDKGIKDLWKNEELLKYTQKIRNIEDFTIYDGCSSIDLDIFKD